MLHDVDAPDADLRVVVAISDRDRAADLAQVLTARRWDVVLVADIAAVAEITRDEAFVAIIDDAASEWLRDVSDLLRRRTRALVLALVEVDTSAELLTAVNAGVAGFVSPGATADAIARTVRALVDTGVAIPRAGVAGLVDEVRRGRGRLVNTADGTVELTDREWEIVQLLLQRRSTREIAEILFVSDGTVRSHVSALGRKLGAAGRRDTIRLLEQRRG